MQVTDDLRDLARTLADWAEGVSATIYLFGSRVRGDHSPQSDVDIHIVWVSDTGNSSTLWWNQVNDDLFATINRALPGPLKILEAQDPLNAVIEAAPVIYEDRNVKCVWYRPK